MLVHSGPISDVAYARKPLARSVGSPSISKWCGRRDSSPRPVSRSRFKAPLESYSGDRQLTYGPRSSRKFPRISASIPSRVATIRQGLPRGCLLGLDLMVAIPAPNFAVAARGALGLEIECRRSLREFSASTDQRDKKARYQAVRQTSQVSVDLTCNPTRSSKTSKPLLRLGFSDGT